MMTCGVVSAGAAVEQRQGGVVLAARGGAQAEPDPERFEPFLESQEMLFR